MLKLLTRLICGATCGILSTYRISSQVCAVRILEVVKLIVGIHNTVSMPVT